jgi:integrase
VDWSPLETFLLVREAKADLTVQYMMQRFRRMLEDGFDFQAFAASDTQALQEGDRFLLALRKAKAPRETVRNYQKNLQALSRFHGWKAASWQVGPSPKRAPQVYTLTDLQGLHRLQYDRAQKTRLWRALVMAHLALGWRIGELAKLRVQDVDAANHRVFLAFPEKGNPQRYFPVHESLFSPNRAFMSWIRNRPVPPGDSESVWTYTDPRMHVDRACTQHYLAKELSLAGRSVGVRTNCQRGRPTCLTALIVQKKSLAFVKYWAGHEDYSTLADYVAYVDHGLAKHLRTPGWFSHAPTRTVRHEVPATGPGSAPPH